MREVAHLVKQGGSYHSHAESAPTGRKAKRQALRVLFDLIDADMKAAGQTVRW